MREEHLVQGFPEILQQMKAVCDLDGRGRALACALRIGARPIPGDDLHPGMLPEPLGHGLGRAIREQRHGLAALQIDQDRAIRLAFPQGEIVHPEHRGAWARRGGLPAEQAQQRVAAHGQTPALAQTHPGLAPQGDAEGDEALGEPQRAPRPGGGHRGQPFGEDAADDRHDCDRTTCGRAAGGARGTLPTADRPGSVCNDCGYAAPGWRTADRARGSASSAPAA